MKKLNPIYSFFGFQMRLNWFESHHLYWGILGMLISLSGFCSALSMHQYGLSEENALVSILGGILAIVQILSFCISLYVALDDIYQHHRQVEEPKYHSPVHYWYRETLGQYPFVIWLNRIVSNFIHNLKWGNNG